MQQDIWARIVTMTRTDYDNVLSEARREGYQTAITEMQQDQKSKPEPDPLIIAEIAALIFANNTHDFDERRSVESAAKIVKLSRNHEK